jgi:hypothetical protein
MERPPGSEAAGSPSGNFQVFTRNPAWAGGGGRTSLNKLQARAYVIGVGTHPGPSFSRSGPETDRR